MKSYKLGLVIGILGVFLLSCTKNDIVLDVSVKVDKHDITAGEKVVFTIEGVADFITFYSGNDSATMYTNYPFASGLTVGSGALSQSYNKHGTVKATFIAASYGDWGEESKIQQFDFDINVVDNRTSISSFMIKKSGLGGVEYYGIINEKDGTVNIVTAPGSDISNMQTTLITESVQAVAWKDGKIFVNKSKVDYSGENVVFNIEAPDGTKRDWKITVSND